MTTSSGGVVGEIMRGGSTDPESEVTTAAYLLDQITRRLALFMTG
jgi:hypothetical protein